MSLKNSKLKLLGSDTHAADLTGSATQAQNTTNEVVSAKSGFTVVNDTVGEAMNTSSGGVEASVVVTTPSDSLVVIVANMFSVNDSAGTDTHNIRILDGTTELASTSIGVGSNSSRLIPLLFVGVPLTGSRTYNVEAWSPGGGILVSVSINVTHVQLTDTHAASLTGSNTQTTHEDRVLL